MISNPPAQPIGPSRSPSQRLAMIAPNSGSEPISSDTRVALLRPSARFCAYMANSVANSTRYSAANQNAGSPGSAGSSPGKDKPRRIQPLATTPLCTAVSASAGISRPAVNRRVRQTSTARSNAAASISASPRFSDSCGPPVSITPQVSQRNIASITSPSGRPGRSARRPTPRSCGSSRTNVRPKRIARKPSTG